MRPTIFGKQVVTRNGILCGVNLGYNFYTEHERGINDLLTTLNNNLTENYVASFKDKLAFDKKVRADNRKMNKFRSTPFKNCIVRPSTRYIRREIIINNDELKNRYCSLMLENTNYTLLVFGSRGILDVYGKKLEGKRKFSEADFMYVPDYNLGLSPNIGAILSGKSTCKDIGIGTISTVLSSSWDNTGFLIFIKKDSIYSSIPDNIENNLKAGGLALVSETAGLFRDRGLGLVFLDNMYKQ